MILIHCPSKKVSKRLIEYFNLVYDSSFQSYSVYSRQGMVLIIPQKGLFSACSASSYLLSRFENQKKNLVCFHIGLSERTHTTFKTGELVIGNKISSSLGSFSFYPDLLLKTYLKEAEVITVREYPRGPSRPASGKLLDLEAYGFCEGVFPFVGPHQVMVLKIISGSDEDHSDSSSLPFEDLSILHLELLDLILHKYVVQSGSTIDHPVDWEEFDRLHHQLTQHLHLTKSLAIELEKHLRWSYTAHVANCSDKEAGIRIQSIAENIMNTTVSSKKEGIHQYEKLKNQLLSLEI